MTDYFKVLIHAMSWLGNKPDVMFLGQQVEYAGTYMHETLGGVSARKRLEFPVCEDMNIGAAIGLSLEGIVPVVIIPRWNFLLLATNQIVNHADKLPLYSAYRPHVIIRTAIGASSPLDPGPQHVGDFTDAFRLMCKTVEVVRLDSEEDILPAYRKAYHGGGVTILVEHGDKARA